MTTETQDQIQKKYDELSKYREQLKTKTFPYRYGHRVTAEQKEAYEALLTTLEKVTAQLMFMRTQFVFTRVELVDRNNFIPGRGGPDRRVVDEARLESTIGYIEDLQERYDLLMETAAAEISQLDTRIENLNAQNTGLQVEFGRLSESFRKLEKTHEGKVRQIGELMGKLKKSKTAHVQVTSKPNTQNGKKAS